MVGRDEPLTPTTQFAGEEYQHVRFLLRRARRSLVAINGYSIPIIDEILRYGNLIPTLRRSIIALAQNQRYLVDDGTNASSPRGDGGVESLASYQSALLELRLELSQLAKFGIDPTNSTRLQGSLASALLLSIFAMPLPEFQWGQHVNGLLTLIQSANFDDLCASRLGQFVAMHASQCDISAFSLGRETDSINAWYQWHTMRQAEIEARRDITIDDGWLPHEISVGYPISLLDVVAQLSKWTEDDIRSSPTSDLAAETPELQLMFLRREALIYSWTPPLFPQSMPAVQKLALSTAWETIRRAALIFLWRGRGFHSNYWYAMRADRSHMVPILIREIITGVSGLINAYNANEITIGNAMLWPLTVIACECIGSQSGWQAEVALLFESLKKSFAIRHTTLIRSVLLDFWELYPSLPASMTDTDRRANPLNLERIVRLRGWVLPLL